MKPPKHPSSDAHNNKMFFCVIFFFYSEQDLIVEINAHIISQYRYLWLNLSELLQALGNAYARTYSTYCLFM